MILANRDTREMRNRAASSEKDIRLTIRANCDARKLPYEIASSGRQFSAYDTRESRYARSMMRNRLPEKIIFVLWYTRTGIRAS